MVFELGKFILKYGKVDNAACISHFLVDLSKESNMEITPLLACHIEGSDCLTGFDKQIEVKWDEQSSLNNDPNLQENFTKFYIKNVFNKVLTINNKENSAFLHVFLHFPLYKPEAVETVKLFYNGIESSGKPTKIDFIGYGDDLADIIDPKIEGTTPAYEQIRSFSKFREEKKWTYDKHFIVIQNSSQSGISLSLNLKTLTDVIGWFSLLCAEYYDEIFPNAMAYRDVFSFGFSTLCLDKYLFVKYLLGKTLLNSMDKAEVNKSEVNVNIAGDTANELLSDRVTILSKYYSQIDEGKVKIPQTANFHQTQQTLDEEVNEIIEKSRIILFNNKSITTKSAIIAAILGTNCELFSQSIFNENSVNIEDLYNESLNCFI
jgi:hypothetical protein